MRSLKLKVAELILILLSLYRSLSFSSLHSGPQIKTGSYDMVAKLRFNAIVWRREDRFQVTLIMIFENLVIVLTWRLPSRFATNPIAWRVCRRWTGF